MLTDYHVHLRPDDPGPPPSELLHAPKTPSDTGKSRKSAAIKELGVSEHVYRFSAALEVWRAPVLAPERAPTTSTRYGEFVREETDLRLGIEADYIRGTEDKMANLLDRHDWDYVIGSVHFLGEHAVDIVTRPTSGATNRAPSGSGRAISRRSPSPP